MDKGILSGNFPISVAVHLDYRQPELLEECAVFLCYKAVMDLLMEWVPSCFCFLGIMKFSLSRMSAW